MNSAAITTAALLLGSAAACALAQESGLRIVDMNQLTPGASAPGLSAPGVQWRHAQPGASRVDITAWRSAPPTDAASLALQQHPVYGARVEMSLDPVQRTGLVAEKGFVGMQLESGARITLKRSGGKPMMYYRNKF